MSISSNDIVLESKDLSAFFGDFQAVKNVSLKVPQNRIVAMIGPSGCGKSTFLRCLNRLHEETEGTRVQGEVFLQGQNIYQRRSDPVEIRSKIGMVFQKPNPFPSMTVYENVAAGLVLRGLHRSVRMDEIVEQSLRQAALWEEVKDKLKKPGTSLSGGQQQRLCIARALAIRPSVLLMDEPTSALDPISTAKIEELLHHIKNEVTILIVTHSMHQASRVSDHTAFFLSGELLEYGQTQDVFLNPQHPKTEQYISGRFG
jgi:phosphate transport system ATP-binding protein